MAPTRHGTAKSIKTTGLHCVNPDPRTSNSGSSRTASPDSSEQPGDATGESIERVVRNVEPESSSNRTPSPDGIASATGSRRFSFVPSLMSKEERKRLPITERKFISNEKLGITTERVPGTERYARAIFSRTAHLMAQKEYERLPITQRDPSPDREKKHERLPITQRDRSPDREREHERPPITQRDPSPDREKKRQWYRRL